MRFLFLFLILCFPMTADAGDVSREIPYADAIPFLGIEDSARQVKKSVFAIQVPEERFDGSISNWIPLGTGFLITAEPNAVLAITCKHVVQVAINMKKPIFIGLDTDKGYRRFRCNISYIDPTQDIAVLMPMLDNKEELRFLSTRFDLADYDDDSSLVEGRTVVIPGYPLSLGIEDDRNYPIIRFGFVAQFTGKDYFLLDGVASHGNSGSPVFSLKHKANKLIGMVTSFHNDKINLYDDSGSITASLPYNSGLAKCLTMKTILATVKKAVQVK